jgi:DNA-binding ferritin-like protein
MHTPGNLETNPILFTLIPVLPSAFFGLILVWQQGASLASVPFAFLMVLFSLVSSYFIWVWHADQLEKLGNYHKKHYSEGLHMLKSYTVELERLLLMVEPKLAEQILAARELTEQEISLLVQRFSTMNAELKQIFDLAEQTVDTQTPEVLDNLKKSVGKVRNEIDVVLEALQFQDRVSQILALVQTNLATLRETLEHIQQQGPERHKEMLNVEEMLAHIQAQYETVKHSNNHSTAKQSADDLTFF